MRMKRKSISPSGGGSSVVELQKGKQKEKEKEKEEETLEPPKLDDGFYEIETIRRKRVRKGEVQYLIKWRGWPDTANTWEPLHNLQQSVPDLILAFEDLTLKSEKHRKPRRNHVVHHTLLNKRHQRSTTPYCLRRFPTSKTAGEGQTNGDPTTLGKSQQANVTAFANTAKLIVERNEENDNDPKLGGLKATTNNAVDADKLTIPFQQAKVSTGNSHMDGPSKVDCMEPDQSGRCRGAKRRKSGSVKRFKKDTHACKQVDTHNAIGMSVGTVEPGCTGIASYMENDSHKKMGDAKTACDIVKIIKPIGYSASLSCNIQDALVTFMAMRSDGTEVMVDNKYLKAYNPLLLINFYEQHLRYNPTS